MCFNRVISAVEGIRLINKYSQIALLSFSEKPFGSSSTPNRIRTLIIEGSPEPIRGMPWGLGLALVKRFLQARTGVRVEEFDMLPFRTFGWGKEGMI